MNYAREQHTASLLKDGKVLVTGGFNHGVLSSTELYDPLAETWTDSGNMNVDRFLHTASVLSNGKILVTGGSSHVDTVNSAELFDPFSCSTN